MSSCLGLFIQNNIIKYAKVSKERNDLKVESFGVKFYDDINEAVNQIVEETYSFKTPISVNLSEETYNYFQMFSMLNNKDLSKAIKTEFEAYCSEKGYNPNVFESRYAVSDETEEKDKLRVIHVSENKIELNKRIQQLEGYKVISISPISMSITNLLQEDVEDNCIIVNIEDKTTITTILNKKIYNIEVFDLGSEEFLSKINLKENSYSKSYEICKNTTIYTSEGRELQEVQTNYLEDIMPVLYEIVGNVRKSMNENLDKIKKVYLTGTATLINNADLYFQEYLSEVDCEILKPYFVQATESINVKDYMEVNSALSLALSGLGEGIQGMNFKNQKVGDKLPDWLKLEVGDQNKTPSQKKNSGGWFTNDLGQKLDRTEKGLLRTAVSLLMLFGIYTAFSILLNNQLIAKTEEANEYISHTNSQIQLAEADNQKIKSKTNEYTTLIQNLQEINDRITDENKTRNAIPNLLNQLMTIIPETVQITSIQNTTNRHIEIYAQSDKYEQLGYLKAKIKTDVILTDVISTAGEKENSIVSVKIEGDLP